MCRFVRDGEPDIGEYRELADGTGICVLADMNGDSEEVVVSLPDGTMPENISDLELLKVPTTMHGPESGPLTPAEVAERMARTDFIIEEYKTGILESKAIMIVARIGFPVRATISQSSISQSSISAE